MCGSSVLCVKLRHFVGFSRQDKKTALTSCLYLLPLLYVTEALKFSRCCLWTYLKTQHSSVTGLFRSQKFTWPPCNIMKDRSREIARWRTFLGNGIRMKFLVTLFGSHDCHIYHEKWHYFIWQPAKLVCLSLYRDRRQHSAANIPICLESTW